MLPAFLTTLLFSLSGVTAMRSTRFLPSLEANFWRLLVATLVLAAYGEIWGGGLGGPAFGWFVLSGLIGFGIGDIALYLAYPKLGSRLVVLIVHCVASPLAAAIEWLALGVPMTGREMIASGLILSGVALAMYPDPRPRASGAAFETAPAARRIGLAFALVAAAGQGIGAVLSRHAFEITRAAGVHLDGLTAAYQRILAGVALSTLTYLWSRRTRAHPAGGEGMAESSAARWARRRQAAPWVLINALAGPALGVGCFQWALAERGTGVVLPIVALTPLVIVPLAMLMEGERPSGRSVLGGLVAVAGAVVHAVSHAQAGLSPR